MDKNSLSHTTWKCQYHIVFIPKYRKKSLYGQVRTDVREIIQTLCRYKGVEIIEGAVCIDHVHLCVSIPLKMNVPTFMGYRKGKSTLIIYDRHPNLQYSPFRRASNKGLLEGQFKPPLEVVIGD